MNPANTNPLPPDAIRGPNQDLPSQHDLRFQGLVIGIVTSIDDPNQLRRIKVRFQFQEQGQESGWLWDGRSPFGGPTDMKRQMTWGVDWPVPEVGCSVLCLFENGDVHNGFYIGVWRYNSQGYGIPGIPGVGQNKDGRNDWSFRIAFANGTHFGVDTEGNFTGVIAGNAAFKVLCNLIVTASGMWTIWGMKGRLVGKAVLKQISAAFHTTNYVSSTDPDLRSLEKDAMTRVPGKPDPGITPPPEVEN
jgi:hypothetical protein